MITTGRTKTKQTRQGARIWLEGTKLNAAGFKAGTRYSILTGHNSIVLSTCRNGDKCVSGKAERPIVDINNNAILAQFGIDAPLAVSYDAGVITLTTEETI